MARTGTPDGNGAARRNGARPSRIPTPPLPPGPIRMPGPGAPPPGPFKIPWTPGKTPSRGPLPPGVFKVSSTPGLSPEALSKGAPPPGGQSTPFSGAPAPAWGGQFLKPTLPAAELSLPFSSGASGGVYSGGYYGGGSFLGSIPSWVWLGLAVFSGLYLMQKVK